MKRWLELVAVLLTASAFAFTPEPSYTPRGEAFRVWGDVPYPAEYHYNACGDLTNLVTFRGGSGWTSSAWPAVSAGGLKPATDGHFKTSHSEARSSYHFRSSDQELSIAR
jgi:hypothetical protein